METLGTRIKKFRLQKKMTQEELGKIVGVKKSSVSQWENGLTKKMNGEYLVRTAKALGVNALWLSTGEGHPNSIEIENNSIRDPQSISNGYSTLKMAAFKPVPVVGTAQLGDNGHWTDLEYPVGFGDGYLTFPSVDANAYALRCVGDSMKPRIKDGEFVIIEPNREPTPGDEVLVKSLDGRVMVKTLLYIRNERVHVMSINEAHPQQSFALSEIDKIHPVAAIVNHLLWIKFNDSED